MFTLQINLTDKNKNEYSKYYCKKLKRFFVLSAYIDHALKFKSIGTAKRSFNYFIKKRGSYKNILGYDITSI